MKINRDFWEELFNVCCHIRDGAGAFGAVGQLEMVMHDGTVYLPAELVAESDPEKFMDTLPAVTEALGKLRELVRKESYSIEDVEDIDILCERLIGLIADMYDVHEVWTH